MLLGIAAASGALPVAREKFEDAIREGGIAVEQNLAAFAKGWELGEAGVPPDLLPRDDRAPRPLAEGADALIATVRRDFPAAAVAIVEEGLRRTADYQDAAYARLYYERVRRIAAIDRGGDLTAEAARYLALWMSYEDVIRVADLKTRPERFAKVMREIRARPGEPVRITEFLKPGIDEMSAVMPARIGRAIERWAERRGLTDRLHIPMRLQSTSISGFARLWALAKMRRFRRASHRFVEEQRAIEEWLDAVVRAAPASPELAQEIVLCARLLKGYGDTYRRGRSNYRRIFADAVVPALAHPERRARPAASARCAKRRSPIPRENRSTARLPPPCRKRRKPPSRLPLTLPSPRGEGFRLIDSGRHSVFNLTC